MKPIAFAWRSLTRQPARAVLGIAGVAIVGALLFDMLLLSRGLALSFRDLLESIGYDVRVTAGQFVPSRGPAIRDGTGTLATLRGLPEIVEVAALRFGKAQIAGGAGESVAADLTGVEGPMRGAWTVIEGHELPPGEARPPALLLNRALAGELGVTAGDIVRVRGTCAGEPTVRPALAFAVTGIFEWRFDSGSYAAATSMGGLVQACELDDPEAVTLFMAASRPDLGPDAAARAIARALPQLHAFTNQEFVDRLQLTDFSYFRQISFVLATITLFFAGLLIATLLTVSVNQRLGEVAALRALGFRRARVALDLVWESALLVGSGSALALPLGGLLALRLDLILRQMPGIPVNLHFFVFDPRATIVYALLMTCTAALAAAYPVWLAARLPIAATLRCEMTS